MKVYEEQCPQCGAFALLHDVCRNCGSTLTVHTPEPLDASKPCKTESCGEQQTTATDASGDQTGEPTQPGD